MSKITLQTVLSSYSSASKINSNFAEVATAFENTLSRDGIGPNFMQASLDMNSHSIINLPAPVTSTDAVNKAYVDTLAFGGTITYNVTGRTLYTDNYTTLAALASADGLVNGVVVHVKGRSSTNDGGEGSFYYDSTSSATADGGITITCTAGGRFIRLNAKIINPLWFSSELGAGLTAAANAMNAIYGHIKLTPGSYTLSTQAVFPKSKNFYRVEMDGCRISITYTGGSSFKIGDGTGLTQLISFTGNGTYIDQADSVNQPLFELRGLRGFYLEGFRGAGLYQICKWGDPADASQCYQWWHTNCEWNMRPSANGGHHHAVDANGSAGGYYETQCSIEGDQAVSNKAFFYVDSTQGSARFDHMVRTGGLWRYFTWGLYAKNGRFVNIDFGAETRVDDMTAYGVYIECTAAGTKGGIEGATFRGTFGGASAGGVRLISDNPAAGANIQNVMVENMHGCLTKEFVYASTVGTGSMKHIHVRNNHIWDANPATATTDCIVFDGDITESSIRGNTLDGKSGATYKYRYFIYNNTASAKSVWIGADNRSSTADVNTAVVYDPNIGDLSIGRFCAMETDGTPRQAYTVTFAHTDFLASQTDAALGVYDATSKIITTQRVLRRCRAVGATLDLSSAVAAGQLAVGVGTGSTINTNLDVVLTSDTGGVVSYPAGSAEIAAGGLVKAFYTTNAGVTLGLDGVFRVHIQEM